MATKPNPFYVSVDQAQKLGLPSTAEQIEQHNRRMRTRELVKCLTTRSLEVVLMAPQNQYPETIEEYRAELNNRRVR